MGEGFFFFEKPSEESTPKVVSLRQLMSAFDHHSTYHSYIGPAFSLTQ